MGVQRVSRRSFLRGAAWAAGGVTGAGALASCGAVMTRRVLFALTIAGIIRGVATTGLGGT